MTFNKLSEQSQNQCESNENSLQKAPTIAAACAAIVLSAQIQASEVMKDVDYSMDNNSNTLVVTGVNNTIDLSVLNPETEVSSKEIRDYVISLGINPTELPGITVKENKYTPGQFQESILISELNLNSEHPFTIDNIGAKFEGVLQSVKEKYPTLYFDEGVWTERFAELSPNEDEVEVLNKFIAMLPEEVKPVPLVNALTGLIALKKYSEMDISKISESEKVILNANIHSVLSVISPELVEGSLALVLPKGFVINNKVLESEKSYSSVEINQKVLRSISSVGVELPIELRHDMQSVYKEYQLVMSNFAEDIKTVEHERKKARMEKAHKKYTSLFNEMTTASKVEVLSLFQVALEDDNEKIKDLSILRSSIQLVEILDADWDDTSSKKLNGNYRYFTKLLPESENVITEIFKERVDIMKAELAKEEQELAKNEAELAKNEAELAKNEAELAKNEAELAKNEAILVKKEQEVDRLLKLNSKLELLASI